MAISMIALSQPRFRVAAVAYRGVQAASPAGGALAGGMIVATAAGLPALVGSFLAAGPMLMTLFGVHALIGGIGGLTTWAMRRQADVRVVGLGAGSFLATSLVGALATGFDLASMGHLPLSAVFATLYCAAAARALGAEGVARRALYVGATTCFVHLLVLLNAELLRGWLLTVDLRTSVQSAVAANLLAGLVGGAAAGLLLLDGIAAAAAIKSGRGDHIRPWRVDSRLS